MEAAELTLAELRSFRPRVVQTKLDLYLYTLLKEIKTQGHRIYGIGAPSRATTPDQLCGARRWHSGLRVGDTRFL